MRSDEHGDKKPEPGLPLLPHFRGKEGFEHTADQDKNTCGHVTQSIKIRGIKLLPDFGHQPGCSQSNEGKTGNECLPLNYNNNGFVYTFSENAELLPSDVKAAAQAAWDKLVATANTLDYKTIELK